MGGEIFVGHHCPKCGSTVALSAGVGGPLRCPGCGGPMQAASGGPDTRIIANVKCDNCGSIFGAISVVGSKSIECPSCGKPLL